MKSIFFLSLFCTFNLYAQQYKVLFISSYNSSFPTVPKQIEGIVKILDKSVYQLDIEYMDSKRVDPILIEPLLYKSFELKKDILKNYDAILVGDDNALHFVTKYQKEFFANKPIVFLAINNEKFALQTAKDPHITGIIEKSSIKETLQLILKLHPNYKKVIVLSDNTPTSQGILDGFKDKDLQLVEIISLKNYNFSEFLNKLNSLPSGQPLLYISAMSDKDGKKIEFFDSIRLIQNNVNLPLYHLYEHGIGHGMLGGKVVMFSTQGELAASMVKDIIAGKNIKNIPIINESTNRYLFDYIQLKRFDLEDKIPKNAIVLNEPKPFLEQTITNIMGGILFILGLLFSYIIYLLVQKNSTTEKLKQSNQRLFDTISEQQTILSLFDISDIVLFRWNNDEQWSIDHVSKNVKHLLGYSKEEFLNGTINYSSCIHHSDLQIVIEEVESNKKNNYFKHEPYRIITKDNQTKWVLDYTVVQKDENNIITHFFGYIIDITHLKNLEEKLHLFREIIEKADIGITIADATKSDMPLIFVNDAFVNLTEYKKEEVINRNCKFLQNDDTFQEEIGIIRKILIEEKSCEVELRNYTKSGKLFWNLLTLTPLFDKHNNLEYYVGMQHNITKYKNFIKQLEKLIDQQSNIIILTDAEKINFANKKFFEFIHYTNLEEFFKDHQCICELFLYNDRFFHLGKINKDQNWIKEIDKLPDNEKIVGILGKDLEIHAFNVAVNQFDDNLFIISFTDISKTMIENIHLLEKTIHDKLTGAYNREFFETNHKTYIKKFLSDDNLVAVAFLDIDHFKKVNDTYGHDVGDEVLIQFVKTVQKHSRDDDLFIRWGGEEFILLLKVKLKEDLHTVLEHLRDAIENQIFPIVGTKTCSIGATFYQESEDIEQSIKRADKAVYKAKANGRNQVVII